MTEQLFHTVTLRANSSRSTALTALCVVSQIRSRSGWQYSFGYR